MQFSKFVLITMAAAFIAACGPDQESTGDKKAAKMEEAHTQQSEKSISLHKAQKNADAQPVIWIGDFNNFDDAVALMLIAKDPRYSIELAVVEDSFNTVAHGANMVYRILEWLGNRDTEVIRGAYYAPEEIALGANGANAKGTQVSDENAPVPGVVDYQMPNSKNAKWNLERRNVIGLNIYGQYVPGPWRDNGSTLYATDHLIPLAQQENYHFTGNSGMSYNFKQAEDMILEKLNGLSRKAILFNTGKFTTFARVLSKATDAHIAKIDKVIMMGGGFEGEEPFVGERKDNLGGNIFSHPSFGPATDFSTHQEFNILLDPLSAKVSFDLLAKHKIESYLVPTNATDLAKLKVKSIGELAVANGTPEACYTSKLLMSLREFEGGNEQIVWSKEPLQAGDFVLDKIIRLWDIIAALVLIEPESLKMTTKSGLVDVVQLGEGFAKTSYGVDPISFNPKVGKTLLQETNDGIQVLLGINVDSARQAMIDRLLDKNNAAVTGPVCH